MQIIEAKTSHHLKEVRRLFREYEAFLQVDLQFQGFENELAELPGKYTPPKGELLLAVKDQNAAGCVAVRELEGDICEMKRLYIEPEFRNTGLGKRLAIEIIDVAGKLGYTRMRLDTLENLKEAMGLYQSLGFIRIPAYYHNPLENVIYWELNLMKRSKAIPS